jgi:hypothetical protein
MVRFSEGAKDFSALHSVETGTGTHSASYPMITRVSFSESKAAEA